ncbi:MAG: pinensin family lanthipeptide [Bacteroidota bacterium]
MKNRKLNLDTIKVKSFITSLEKEKGNTVKGGHSGDNSCYPVVCTPDLSEGPHC